MRHPAVRRRRRGLGAAAGLDLDGGSAGGYALNGTVAQPLGHGTDGHAAGGGAGWAWGPWSALRIRVKGGTLESACPMRCCRARTCWPSAMALPRWELLQFAEARLVSAGLWEISMRLRGQAGTDAFMPAVWPVGSTVVLLDGGPAGIWRLRPATSFALADRACDTGARRHSLSPDCCGVPRRRAAAAVALSPLSCSGRMVTWTRRTRVQGDGWDGPTCPWARRRSLLGAG